MKCAFAVDSGMLLGCIVSAEGIAVDPAKVEAIWQAEIPGNSKQLGRFLGQVKWHSKMLRYLADVAAPLYD